MLWSTFGKPFSFAGPTNTTLSYLKPAQRMMTVLTLALLCPVRESRTQSPQASWSAGDHRERLWSAGSFIAGTLRLPFLVLLLWTSVNSQSNCKTIIFFHLPRVSPGERPLTKNPEYSGNEIAWKADLLSATPPRAIDEFDFVLILKAVNMYLRLLLRLPFITHRLSLSFCLNKFSRR